MPLPTHCRTPQYSTLCHRTQQNLDRVYSTNWLVFIQQLRRQRASAHLKLTAICPPKRTGRQRLPRMQIQPTTQEPTLPQPQTQSLAQANIARARARLPYTLTHAHTIAPTHCRTHIEAHTEATLIHTGHSNTRTHQHTHLRIH